MNWKLHPEAEERLKIKTSFWPESLGSVRGIIVLSHIVFVTRCFDPRIDPCVFAARCHYVRILL